MEIVAFDTNDKADGTGKAKITWISKGLLNTEHNMNSTDTNEGGWESSEMRTYLKNTIKPLIPETVRNAIVDVLKVQSIYNESSGDRELNGQTTIDDVWIPSDHEITSSNIYENIGAAYATRFNDQISRRKKRKYDSVAFAYEAYALRSAPAYANSFRRVTYEGKLSNTYASTQISIALGFCT